MDRYTDNAMRTFRYASPDNVGDLVIEFCGITHIGALVAALRDARPHLPDEVGAKFDALHAVVVERLADDLRSVVAWQEVA